jgi:hypothetical protein
MVSDEQVTDFRVAIFEFRRSFAGDLDRVFDDIDNLADCTGNDVELSGRKVP